MLGIGLLSSPGLFNGRNADRSSQQRYNRKAEKRPEKPGDFVARLTAYNVDTNCGTAARNFCVVLITKPQRGFGDREVKLLEHLRDEAAKNLRNPRGQSIGITWTTVTAEGRWSSFLPAQAPLPWVVVVKSSHAGPRVAVLPVPNDNAKKRRRLNDGVPQ